MIPPPFPTKPLVLAAGFVRTPLTVFSTAVLIGRLLRYGATGCLGSRFGDQAARSIQGQYPWLLLVLAGVALLCLLVRRFLRYSRHR